MSEHRNSEFGTAMSGLIGVGILIAVVYFLTAAQFSGDRDIGTPEQVLARIAPIGSVNLAGAEAMAPTVALAAPTTAEESEGPGAAIYNKTCTACHTSGVAGAPKLGDKAAWEPRLARGLDQLLQTAIAGKGAMPPRGSCLDCSDDDLRAAIEYMLGQVGYEPSASSPVGDPPPEGDMAGMGGAPATEGMSGTSDMSGMAGLSGMSGMSGMRSMFGMGGMSGMSGEYRTGPDGSIYLYPSVPMGTSGTEASAEGASSEIANPFGPAPR